MDAKSDDEIFLEHAPMFNIWHKVIILYFLQILLFSLSFLFFWYISSTFLVGALLAELIIVFCGTYPYKHIVKNIEKIRKEYTEKYKKLAAQTFWLRYESYTIPLMSSSLYFPLLLKSNYYVYKELISLPDHLITQDILFEYIAIPVGLILVTLGFLIRRAPSGFSSNIENYLYTFYPEKGTLVKKGIYQFIRHPRYLSRGFVAIGFGVIANNILAISVGIIHFLVFCSVIPSEEKELKRRFGSDYTHYRKNVPALVPKFKNWKKFLKIVFTQKDTI